MKIHLKFKIYNLKLRLLNNSNSIELQKNDKLQNLKKCHNDAAGFSLIEVLIALAIFTFIIGGVVMFSVNSIKANTRSQAMQEAMDNARYAMDDLAKKVRTSSGVHLSGTDNNELFFVDNKTLTKYCYKFEWGQMQVTRYIPTIIESGLNAGQMEFPDIYNLMVDCTTLSATTNDFASVVGEGAGGKVEIGGRFEVMKTDILDDDNPHRGFVRIIIDMVYNDSGSPENRAEMHLQSGVSIADYSREDDFELDATVAPPP